MMKTNRFKRYLAIALTAAMTLQQSSFVGLAEELPVDPVETVTQVEEVQESAPETAPAEPEQTAPETTVETPVEETQAVETTTQDSAEEETPSAIETSTADEGNGAAADTDEQTGSTTEDETSAQNTEEQDETTAPEETVTPAAEEPTITPGEAQPAEEDGEEGELKNEEEAEAVEVPEEEETNGEEKKAEDEEDEEPKLEKLDFDVSVSSITITDDEENAGAYAVSYDDKEYKNVPAGEIILRGTTAANIVRIESANSITVHMIDLNMTNESETPIVCSSLYGIINVFVEGKNVLNTMGVNGTALLLEKKKKATIQETGIYGGYLKANSTYGNAIRADYRLDISAPVAAKGQDGVAGIEANPIVIAKENTNASLKGAGLYRATINGLTDETEYNATVKVDDQEKLNGTFTALDGGVSFHVPAGHVEVQVNGQDIYEGDIINDDVVLTEKKEEAAEDGQDEEDDLKDESDDETEVKEDGSVDETTETTEDTVVDEIENPSNINTEINETADTNENSNKDESGTNISVNEEQEDEEEAEGEPTDDVKAESESEGSTVLTNEDLTIDEADLDTCLIALGLKSAPAPTKLKPNKMGVRTQTMSVAPQKRDVAKDETSSEEETSITDYIAFDIKPTEDLEENQSIR